MSVVEPTEPGKDRANVPNRAGTRIDHENAIQIMGQAMYGTRVHGVLDPVSHVYQSGGELSNFVYWKEKLVSISIDVFDQIKGGAKFIEMIDHKKNECYRISMETALKEGRTYNAGIGLRFGIPLDLFKRSGPVANAG